MAVVGAWAVIATSVPGPFILLGDVAAPGIKPRIVGGKPAAPGDYPWMVGILAAGEPDSYEAHFCGGVLVHPHWVVTAAHCVFGDSPEDLQVFVGSHDLEDGVAGRRIDVLDIIRHPNYDDDTLDSDLALLLLAAPGIDEAGVLAIIDEGIEVASGTPARVLGWGATDPEETEYPSELQEADLVIASLEEAEPGYGPGELTDNMLFAGVAAGGRDTCGGDSGGPLVVRGPDDSWILAGVTSFGTDLGCAAPDRYGAYTKLSRFSAWIRTQVAPNLAAWESVTGERAGDADADGNGRPDWADAAVWHDPGTGMSSWLPEVLPPGGGGGSEVVVRFRRFAEPSEVRYRFETWSPGGEGGGVWRPVDPAELAVLAPPSPLPGAPGAIVAEIEARLPLGEFPSGFARLRLERDPEAVVVGDGELTFPGFLGSRLHGRDRVDGAGRPFKRFRLAGLEPGSEHAVLVRSEAFDARLEVVDLDDGRSVAISEGGSAGGGDERIRFVPQDGRSYAAVAGATTAGATGPFTVALESPFENLPTLAVPGSVSGALTRDDALDPRYYPDEYRLDEYALRVGATGRHVIIEMESGSVDAWIDLIDLETREVVVSDDDSGNRASKDAYLAAFVPAGAAFAVRATTARPRDLGDYRLMTRIGPTIPIGGTRSGRLVAGDPADPDQASVHYRHDYLVDASPDGTTLRVRLGADFDGLLRVVDARTGEVLETADAGGDGEDEVIEFVPAAGRRVFVRVTSSGRLEKGAYSVSVSVP